jgi:hypothetical protein
MTMIENWKQAYKMLSVWVFAIACTLAGLEQFLTVLEGKVPPAVYAGLMILGIVARLVRQRSLRTPESVARELERAREVWDEAMRAKEEAKR